MTVLEYIRLLSRFPPGLSVYTLDDEFFGFSEGKGPSSMMAYARDGNLHYAPDPDDRDDLPVLVVWLK